MELGVTLERYLAAQALVERCLLRFLQADGGLLELFLPQLVHLEPAEKAAVAVAGECARLETLDGQSAVVFYAPKAFAEGEEVFVWHQGGSEDT